MSKRFHPQMSEATEEHLIDAMSSASQSSYGYGGVGHLSKLLSAVKDAIVLRNKHELSVFLFATRDAV